jgi:hypothetical protein
MFFNQKRVRLLTESVIGKAYQELLKSDNSELKKWAAKQIHSMKNDELDPDINDVDFESRFETYQKEYDNQMKQMPATLVDSLDQTVWTPSLMGKKGGAKNKGQKSEARAIAARENGRKGGRPKKGDK